MSESLFDAEQALSYLPPPDLPITVLSVGYGDAIAVPDTVQTVEVHWQMNDRPGTFSDVMAKVGDWQGALDALLRLRVFQVQSVYAALGGWPAPTPLPTTYVPPDDVAFIPDLPPGYILPPGIIGQE